MIDPVLARAIRVLVLDVDGVLTDNGIYIGQVGEERVELKRFDLQDGLGLGLLRGGPIEVVWLSARPSPATTLRATELKIGTVIEEAMGRKLPVLKQLIAALGVGLAEVAYVGDDLADLPAMEQVGLPIAVANAVGEIRRVAKWTTTKPGGHGAVREVVEALLQARGEWESALARYRAGRE